MSNQEDDPINEISKKLSTKSKILISSVAVFIFLLLLCIWGVLPNIPFLQEYGINCGCHESLNTTLVQETEKTKKELQQLQNDTTSLKAKIQAAEDRIAIAERNLNSAVDDKNKLQDELDKSIKAKADLEQLLNETNETLKEKQSKLDSIIAKNIFDGKNRNDSMVYYRGQRDTLKIDNEILSHVHVTSVKAYTDRTAFLDKSKVNKINISYTLSGLETIKKYLNDKSFIVSFQIKDSKGIYKEYGEMNPSTKQSLHRSANDAVSFSNNNGNEIIKDVPFPNWQTSFSISELYTIETYIEFEGKRIQVGETIQNLKIHEKVFAPSELKK